MTCLNPNCYDPRPHEHVVVPDPEHPGFGMTGTRYLTSGNSRRHYTEAETRNQFLCSCDDCSRKAAHAWTREMDRVFSGEQTLAEANARMDRYPSVTDHQAAPPNGTGRISEATCRHCGQPIEPDGDGWTHRCPSVTEEP